MVWYGMVWYWYTGGGGGERVCLCGTLVGRGSGVSVRYTSGGGVLVCLCGTSRLTGFWHVYVVCQWWRGSGVSVWYTNRGGV